MRDSGLSLMFPCSSLCADSSCLSLLISVLLSRCACFFLEFAVVWGVVYPIILMAFSSCSRFVVVSLLTLLQKVSYASFVLGFHPFSEGFVWGLVSVVCASSGSVLLVILQEILHLVSPLVLLLAVH